MTDKWNYLHTSRSTRRSLFWCFGSQCTLVFCRLLETHAELCAAHVCTSHIWSLLSWPHNNSSSVHSPWKFGNLRWNPKHTSSVSRNPDINQTCISSRTKNTVFWGTRCCRSCKWFVRTCASSVLADVHYHTWVGFLQKSSVFSEKYPNLLPEALNIPIVASSCFYSFLRLPLSHLWVFWSALAQFSLFPGNRAFSWCMRVRSESTESCIDEFWSLGRELYHCSLYVCWCRWIAKYWGIFWWI